MAGPPIWVVLFGTDLPIVLAPMAGIIDAEELVIAAAQAARSGSSPCANAFGREGTRRRINVSAGVSTQLMLDFFCRQAVDADPSREVGWKQRLHGYSRG